MAGILFITSDLHIGHKKVAEARGFKTVGEHDDFVLSSIADTVRSDRNVLYLLGDLAFGRHNLEKIAKLPGIKKIILGNHDQYSIDAYRQITEKIFGAFVYQLSSRKGGGRFLMSHIPVSDDQMYRFDGNIHGHLHDRQMNHPWYFNVCLEKNNLKPFELYHVVQWLQKSMAEYQRPQCKASSTPL